MGKVNLKDIAILDAFPLYNHPKTVLEVGCGDGKLDFYLAEMGYKVYATDIKAYNKHIDWKAMPYKLDFYRSDIFDLSSFPIKSSPIVICSQVLEHLSGYKTALVHLLALTEVRLIITVPFKESFFSPDHVNFWDEGSFVYTKSTPTEFKEFKGIDEFIDLCAPYSTTISKIRTKPEDVKMGQWGFLIVVDKRQSI